MMDTFVESHSHLEIKKPLLYTPYVNFEGDGFIPDDGLNLSSPQAPSILSHCFAITHSLSPGICLLGLLSRLSISSMCALLRRNSSCT